MKDLKINYNTTNATVHSRDYYRGASFHFSGNWLIGSHYTSDDYNIDFVVQDQVLLACAKSHLSTLDNEPKDFITDESGTVIGVVSTYWDFVLSGIVGKSPGIKIQDNYWYICKDTGVPEEQQVWENTGVKAKMELSDLTPEEIEILQRPGKEVVTEFINNTMTQSTGDDPEKIMSQKATTDALNTKASKSELSAAVENEVLRANEAYQPKGDYATNTKVDNLQDEVDDFENAVDEAFNAVSEALDTLQDNIDDVADSIPTKVSDLENDSRYQTKTDLDNALNPIKDVIPAEATVGNKLADKNFVTVSIETAKAAFKGVSASGLTEEQFLAWANGLTTNENDYVFWNTVDSNNNAILKRYIRSNSSWVYEYTLSNNSFSTSEWNAIQSGITSELVSKLTNIEAGAQVNILEGVQVSGIDLAITNKKVNVDLTPITNVIPTQASSSNQLADKNFVNSSIATSTATFQGTSAAGLTQAQFEAWLETLTADDNDYVYWNTVDSVGNVVFKRYKYNGTAWVYEYDLNNSSFTSTEWAAIQSGVTAELVTKLVALPTNADLTAALNNKVDKVTGKQLSTEDYTTEEKTKLGRVTTILTGIQPDAETWTGPSPGEAVTHVYIYGINSETGALTTIDLVNYLVPKDSRTNYTAEEKQKLSGIASNAQVNVLEGIKVNGIELPITDKKINIDVTDKVDVADSETNSDEFVYRQTGAGLDIEAKNARISSIKGKTLAWNQLIGGLKVVSGSAATINGGKITINGIATVDESNRITTVIGHKYLVLLNYSSTLVGTFRLMDYVYGSATKQTDISTSGYRIAYISTAARAITDTINLTCTSYTSGTFTGYLNYYDLTLMFGSGNEPTTVEEFESLFPESYYPYNTGELISNDAEAVESVGFNLWDEEWTLTGLNDDGTPYTGYQYLTSKNYIPVKPSTTYYFFIANNYAGLTMKIIQFGAGKTKVGDKIMPSSGIPFSFTTDSDCHYVKFNFDDRYGTTYRNDICISLSDSSRNGTYEPYQKFTLPLNLDSIKVKSHNIWDEEWELGKISMQNGDEIDATDRIRTKNYIPVIGGATYYVKVPSGKDISGAQYDINKNYIAQIPSTSNTTITFNANTAFIRFYVGGGTITTYNHDVCINLSSEFNGKYEPYGDITISGLKSAGSVYDEIVGNKYIQRVGSVDLGSLNWSFISADNMMATAGLNNVAKKETLAPVICALFSSATDAGSANMPLNSCAFQMNYQTSSTLSFKVKTTAYSDAATFKTAMAGVYLNYELATPITYDLAEPLRTDYIVDKLGTERVIAESPICPFRADIHYHEANVKDIEIENMPQYLKREELTDELDKLQDIESGAQVNTIEHIKINGSEQTISNKTVNLPAYPTSLPASDVYSWAKASTKPSYNFSEIGGTVADSQLPDTISSDITGTAMGLKTEKLTDQEFVYRATPNTIKAKSLSLDRIYGKTFVWNQLVQNGNFTSTSGWQTYLSNFTVSNNTATVVNNSARGCIYRDITVVAGHKYFCSASAKSDGTNLFRVRCESAAISNFLNVTSSSFVYGSVIVTAGSNSTYIRIAAGNPDVAATGYVRDIILIDLTIMFGAGNEPSTVEEFESLFPESYYDYNAGTLISNEAKEIESVGFNLWDEEWEQGGCDLNGVNITDASRIRSKNHIPVIASMSYYMYCSTPSNYAGGTMQYNIYYYDLNKNFLSAAGVYNNTIITIPSNAYFVRFTTAGTNRPASASYHNDICINLSDTNKNGTYEPYKKYTHKINLDSFKVTDGTNVYTINGLKSAGNVYDEIVGEKYIKRVGEVDLGTIEWNAGSSGIFISYVAGMGFVYQIGGLVCSKYRPANTLYVQSWSKDKMVGVTNSQASPHLTVKDSSYSSSTAAQFKAAMSGVMLYYELATPETYELVTPLVTSMRAGTTESRISPNADSLSAPFCADMTYSVADYTEYADRAGALVKGASVDLTDITASGELSGNAFKVIAEHIAKLTARVEVLEAGVGTVDTLSSTSVDSANGYYINGDKTVIIGSGAPTMVPAFAGQFYINTSGPALYYAVNNSATTDWKQA